ncbi:MAG TPA: hypothetical protein VHD86_17600, partial [Xanthobacteraceae bacterium]|nr:hypothetical protein [Xanthobacteraceae bacterium]
EVVPARDSAAAPAAAIRRKNQYEFVRKSGVPRQRHPSACLGQVGDNAVQRPRACPAIDPRRKMQLQLPKTFRHEFQKTSRRTAAPQ